MARKGGLGKGLDALIPTGSKSSTQPQPEGGALEVPVEQVTPNPRQPRTRMNEEELRGLAESIREHGVLQPLVVSYDSDVDRYILIAGERRLRASRLAGLATVPVILRQSSEQQRLELALIENVQRADLTPLETAEAYHHLIEDFGLTHEEVAQRVGKSRESVTNTHRLVRLPDEIKQGLAEGLISEGHARALLSLEGRPQLMIEAYKTIQRNRLSVRQTEALVKDLDSIRTQRPARRATPVEVQDLEEQLINYLGTRLKLKYSKDGGTLVIYYRSDEDLNVLVSKILKE